MGRPEPCVLFSQTFVHPHLDEYVDEVMFSEPVVITACEFLEQSVPSACQSVALVGATSPPSFALEVFVQCEGETRFRRLCQPFLYSHSSSNVLEVEAVVTSHLVVRGSYRSLSLVVYGNAAEDLGQFNIEFDDSSLTNIVSSVEGNLEDLPLPLHSAKFTNEELVCSLRALVLPANVLDISVEVTQLLYLVLKMLEVQDPGDALGKAVDAVVSAASAYVACDLSSMTISQKTLCWSSSDGKDLENAISEYKKELLELCQGLQLEVGNMLSESSLGCPLENDNDPITSKLLVDMFHQYFHKGNYDSYCYVHPLLSKSRNVILWLSMALLLCSGRESCFHLVSSGGIDQLIRVVCHDWQNSAAVILLLLGVMEQATRHSIGCEGLLGWWPREDDSVPSGISEGYTQLLKLLLQKPRHDVASLASYVLRRLRTYEVASRYERSILSILRGLSTDGVVTGISMDMLASVKSELKNLLKLVNSHGPMENPSQVARACKSLLLGQNEGSMSYNATSSLITSSSSLLFNWDVDLHLLALLKERGFFPLSTALLSSLILRLEVGRTMHLYMDITSSIGAITFSLLRSRSGLLFLADQGELCAMLVKALKGADSSKKDECRPLRYASNLISKGFFCGPHEVGMILEMHMRVINAIDHLLTSAPHSEEFLWVLWELSAFSRSDCGRQALLILGHFPEAISILIEALQSVKELEPAAKTTGASPLDVAIFHSAAEIFEMIVTDSIASSLGSWIGYAVDLHRAVHSSSPGSNRKDAPTRLLEWIDAGVVYHKNGAIGLLRYAAVLASGGDAHLTSTSILVSDLMDVENAIGDSSGGSELNVLENLGKIISEKTFDGVVLRDSAVAQLITAIRILAFISENPTVAADLYDEGAITVVYAILVNCRYMFERSSNSYDYLVDDGTECNSTSDLLLERNREQSLVDLLVPSMLLLITLLKKLQEANEQHRNTKLMNALLKLHRELSPKLAACAADLASPYPDTALGFEAVCHLIVSALAYWPIFGWTPGLFHSLLTNVEPTNLMALGPKEACSLLCLLNDLFPEEGIWLWKNGMPLSGALRALAVGTVLGLHKEREVNWYLKSENHEKVIAQLTPQLGKIAEMILQYAISALGVIQDMIRVFIIRVTCQNIESASILVRPTMLWIRETVTNLSSPSEIDAYKVYRYLDFLSSLLEHPLAKALLLKEGIIQIIKRVMERCLHSLESKGIEYPENSYSANRGFTVFSWCLPALVSVSLLCSSKQPQYSGRTDLQNLDLTSGDCELIIPLLLKFFQVLPNSKELVACVRAFKELVSCVDGHKAFVDTMSYIQCSDEERDQNYDPGVSPWTQSPPLLCCWKKLCDSFISKDENSMSSVQAIDILSAGCLSFCRDGKSLNLGDFGTVKYLFGLSEDANATDGSCEESMDYINMAATFFNPEIAPWASSLLSLLQKPTSTIDTTDVISAEGLQFPSNDISTLSKINVVGGRSFDKSEDVLKLGGLLDMFLWECPENMPDKGGALLGKRKLGTVDGLGRRGRGENPPADVSASGSFPRGSGPPPMPSGPSRRDNFRLRKPNTSRPPSMHVDDYVARERIVDGGTDVIAIPRAGSSSGRPPSIHVDEFMARQRERQNSHTTVVGEAVTQPRASVPAAAPGGEAEAQKIGKDRKTSNDLDEDINIVFDGEDSDPDDKSLFPQLDENVPQSTPVIVDQNSPPHSIVEETESDVQESGQFSRMGTPVGSNADENNNAQSEFSSRMSAVSRGVEKRLTRESSVTSEKKFDQPSDQRDAITANASGIPASMYPSTGRGRIDSRMSPQTSYPKQSPQPPMLMPLPSMPPPPMLMPQPSDPVAQSNLMTDGQSAVPSPYQGPSDYTSVRPPLPPTPPPYMSSPYTTSKPLAMQPSVYGQANSGTQEFAQSSAFSTPHSMAGPGARIPSYPPHQLMTPMAFNRPASVPMNFYASSPMDNTTIQSMHSLQQLQPLQPPLLPPQPPPHHVRPPSQSSSQQSDQGLAMQNPAPIHPLPQQMLQQHSQVPTIANAFYPVQPPEFSQPQMRQQAPVLPQQGEGASNQLADSGASLADYFRSPGDIQALLSDRDKLCQLLEQHPKLMQMLQERLGQL